MLTVVIPASATRLTTVQHVRDGLGLSADNPSDEVLLQRIDAASQAAVDYCRRAFGRETVLETLRGNDLRYDVSLSRSPIVSGLAVILDGVSGALGADYELDGQSLYRLVGGRRFDWPFGGSLLTVQYTAGYLLPGQDNADLPATVERAAILLVAAFGSSAGRDAAIKSESIEGVGSTSWWVQGSGDALPSPEAQQLLQPYRRLAWSVG